MPATIPGTHQSTDGQLAAADLSGQYAAPQLAISQGTSATPGGQVTIVYDNYGSSAPVDQFVDQSDTVGGTSEQFSYSNGLGVGNIGTSIPITVNITDSKFTTLDNLTITASIAFPDIADIDAYVIPPTALNNYLTLKLDGRANGTSPYNPAQGILLFGGDVGVEASGTPDGGANLGSTSGSGFGTGSGTVFTSEAIRSIEDGTAAATAVGLYQPDGENILLALQKLGLSANAVGAVPGINGVWKFESDQIIALTSTAPQYVNGVTLNFSSGNVPGIGGFAPENIIANVGSTVLIPVPGINTSDPASLSSDQVQSDVTGVSESGNITTTAQPTPILPAAVIASDNTLGSFSEFEGRLYVAFTALYSDSAADNTDIVIFFSDDFGKTWSSGLQVNDDNAATDGYSASGNVDGTEDGRTQYEPQIAVDQSTGDVVLSFLDTRNDPSNTRVATYIAVSNDGGATFAPEVYANPTKKATDAITGNPVNLGPVPDNQSGNIAAADLSSVGFGSHQALIVVNGEIIPFWTSNANNAQPLKIVDSILSLPSGPRIINSTQGPVGESGDTVNTTRAASDGTTEANSFIITFDTPIDPTVATINALMDNTSVFFKSPTGGTLANSLPITNVVALNTTSVGATEFQIFFNPASVLSAFNSYVGTYSYEIAPTVTLDNVTTAIANRIRTQAATSDAAGVFAAPSTTATAVTNQTSYASSTVTASGFPGQYLIANPTGAANVNAAYPTGNVAGTLTATITATSFNGSNPDANYFNVYLVAPDGQRITIAAANYSPFAQPKTTLTFTATDFSVPTFNTVPLDGTYTLEVVDDTGMNKIAISAWHLTLNGVIASAGTTTNGGVMDQAGNSVISKTTTNYVVGQPTGVATYATGTLPLVVPGPHLTGTAAINSAGTVISSGTNNLVLNTTASGLQLTFDRNIQVSSFNSLTPAAIAAAILEIFGPAGTVSTAGITITPVSYYSSGSQVAYPTGGLVADVFDVKFATPQQLSGTYTVTLGTGIVAADGSGIDPELHAGIDELKGIATNGQTVTASYPSTAGVQTIPASNTLTSVPIVVPDDFVVQGDLNGNTLAGLTVTLNITYAVDPKLTTYLQYTSPTGQIYQIELFSNVGNGTNTANFSTTTFSDVANTLISNASAPFFGTFKPQVPLANLATQDGISAIGSWSLIITNSGTGTGTLNSWSLNFQKPISASGLGANQTSTSFQIFNLDPSSQLANSTWTAVGPTGITTSSNGEGTFAGTLSTLAVDPTDPSGNTVYVGSASGGIWKTTDFLTTSAAGPTYVPLTDFGADFSLNIGSIALFNVNNNPSKTVIFAGTGFGQETTTSTGGYANVDLNSGAGVGILKSTDGGQTWTLLDSLNNTLPEAQRDHTFIGTTTFKIVVDPKAEPNGNIIVYAAFGGPNGGLYRSIDSGETWTLLSSGLGHTATDVVLDPNSASPTTGNLQILYVAFPNLGVYQSSNQGQTLLSINTPIGKQPLLTTSGFPAQPIAVANTVSPEVPSSDVVLAKPSLTEVVNGKGSSSEDTAYQGWLYAAVENTNGTFNGLYVTKDDGANWTFVQIGNIPGNGSVKTAVPTNTTTNTDTYDPTADGFSQQGAYDLSLTVDPTNPDIVYIGGTGDFQGSGLIRVDLTDLFDAENFTSFSNEQTDGGLATVATEGGINVATPTNGAAKVEGMSNILNLRYAPNVNGGAISTFATNITQTTSNVGSGFVNTGTGVTWTLFDEPLKANAGDVTGSTNIHDMVSYYDSLTGDVRMLFADDEGVFTALVQPDGTLSSGIGTDVEPNYSRNGNLQDEQFFYGAAQPSSAASQVAGALFYASGQTTIAAQSDPSLISDGNLTYDNSAVLSPSQNSPRNTAANGAISTSDRSGAGIATDPGGSGSVNEFDVPILGGNLTDFFRVNQNGQTTGLANNVNAEFPKDGTRVSGTTGNDVAGAIANGQILQGNFTVNPLNGNQILIASATETLYETVNDGVQWLPIGNSANFDGTSISALSYAAPDPEAPDGVGNLNNFIYVGTSGSVGGSGGQVYVSQAGGSGWTNISSGLDGGSVVGIYPDPNRGSHAAYAVTLTGVFYSSDTILLANSGQTVWTNITSNLTSMPNFAAFNSNSGTANQGTTQYGGFTSIVADYRYLIPASTNTVGGSNNVYYPVLYVSGYGGVWDSIDNGATWSEFPNTTFNNAPVDGGYLPTVDVTNLQFVLGTINPATGHAIQTTGDPEILLATTFGRGNFAISLAPDVFPSTLALDTTLPAPDGSDSGAVRGYPGYTNVKMPVIDGTSEVSNYGNEVYITLTDEANGDLIGSGFTDVFGQFQIQVGSFVIPPGGTSLPVFNDPTFLQDGLKTIGIQATDSAGAMGNIAIFTYNLKATPPANPTNLTLTNESARTGFNNVPNPKSNAIAPTFSVTSTEPTSTEIELYRNTYIAGSGFTGALELVDTVNAGTLPIVNGISTVALTDNNIVAELGGSTVDALVTYYAIQIDLADNYSTPVANIVADDPTKLLILLDNVPPAAPNAPTLDLSTNSGTNKASNITNSTAPLFDVTGLGATITPPTATSVSPYNLELFRSSNGGTPVLVGTALPGVTQIRDTSGTLVNGVYQYFVAQVDLVGNVSALSQGTTVTINTTSPAIPTLQLFAADDTGAPAHPNVTSVNDPRFNGTGTSGLPIILINSVTRQVLTSAVTVSANGTYLTQILGPVADGTYSIIALTTNTAGNYSGSDGSTGTVSNGVYTQLTAPTLPPLTITILNNGPSIAPTLSILPADVTGVIASVSPGVTADHHPAFVGTTNPGVTVKLYAEVNGVLSAAQATTTSSSVNGSFTFQLPYSLTDGTTELVAQSTNIAGKSGALSSPLIVRIISVPGDYYDTGAARLTVFNPQTETYSVQNAGSVQVDTTAGRDVPIQYDLNGDGATDLVAYRFNSAEYYGVLMGSGTPVDTYFGEPGVALPVSGYYGGYGYYINANYNPQNAIWSIALPQAGGFVTQYGVPEVDIPVPAAYDGSGITEIATFRPVAVSGGDADSFNVDAFNGGSYQVSFTSAAVTKLGFVYKTGDIPAPADYDGVGRDEFAIYRPSTGQFFILNTPNPRNSATWTLRTVTLNLPGGPNVNDEPVPADYLGNGKADPAVYRPSNSTYYLISSATGLQSNIQFGTPGVSIAAAGPLLYRLTALQGSYSSTDGYSSALKTSGGGVSVGSMVHAESFVSASTSTSNSTASSSSSSRSDISTLIAVATPIPVTTATPTQTATTTPVVVPSTAGSAVTVGISTPKTTVKTKTEKTKTSHNVKVDKETEDKAKKTVKLTTAETKAKAHTLKVSTETEEPKAKTTSTTTKSSTTFKASLATAALALQKLVQAKKGKKKD